MIDYDNRNVCGIYALVNIWNGKRYIGQSKDVCRRHRKHLSDLLGNRHRNQHLQLAFNRYAFVSEFVFDFVLIEECSSELLDAREIYWISYFHTMDDECGYNLKSGGNAKSYYSKESRRKMSEAQLGHKPPENAIIASTMRLNSLWQDAEYRQKMCEMNRGENNAMYGMKGELSPFYGRSHNEDSKDLVRQYKKQWWAEHTDHFLGDKNPFYGKKHSDEIMQIISAKNKEKWKDPEYRKKHCRRVAQFNLNMIYLRMFDSVIDANKSVGCKNAINSAFSKSKSKIVTSAGYKWMYESDYLAMIGGDVENAS